MKVMVVNCGSSSVKFKIFQMKNESVICSGAVECIGQKQSTVTLLHKRKKIRTVKKIKNYRHALEEMLRVIRNKSIKKLDVIHAVGHRVVHGGPKYSDSVIINDKVIQDIKEFASFAPLHNPHNALGIEIMRHLLPGATHVAAFDTAFHRNMPEYAYLYGLPYELAIRHGIHRYGFHGMSHQYVALRSAVLLEQPLRKMKIITCHIGNGTSITAINHGISVDTSMGMSPLQGVIMGTRSGTIDPSIIELIREKEGLSYEEITNLLNKKSGLLGLSGLSSDYKTILEAANRGHRRSQLTLHILHHQIKKFIGSYIFILNGVDAITFTGGIGENSSAMRSHVCEHLDFLDTRIDEEKNKKIKEGIITKPGSRIKILVVPTDEELMIARETIK